MLEPKRIAMPKTKGLRIEAPGCIIYIDHSEHGGTIVDVVPDGNRFPDQGMMVGRCNALVNAQPAWTPETVLRLHTEVYPQGKGPVV